MFNFSFDKRTMYIIIIVMAIIFGLNVLTDQGALISLLLSAPGVLIAITFHEFAHGFVAYKLGDNTAKNEGRLTLNPFDHLDPIGTLLLLVARIGWGKPVHVNPNNYTRKISMEKGEALVSAAGPAMNIILAFVFALINNALYKFAGTGFINSTVGFVIILLLQSTVMINVGLGIFNLIPLPPLDGSKIIMPFLPHKAKNWFINNEQIFYIVFVLIWVTGIAGNVISPLITLTSNGIIGLANLIF